MIRDIQKPNSRNINRMYKSTIDQPQLKSKEKQIIGNSIGNSNFM